MPKPIYIIASRGLSEDKSTNLLTLFNVVERLRLDGRPVADLSNERGAAEQVPIRPDAMRITIVAVWSIDDPSDAGQNFEHGFGVLIDGENDEATQGIRQPFVFESADKPLKRFIIRMAGVPPINKNCLVEFESRVRRVGDEEWQSQRYPLPCEVIRDEDASQKVMFEGEEQAAE